MPSIFSNCWCCKRLAICYLLVCRNKWCMVYFCLKEILTYFSPNFYQPEKLSATRGHCSSIGKAKLLVLVTDCVHKDFLVFFFLIQIFHLPKKRKVFIQNPQISPKRVSHPSFVSKSKRATKALKRVGFKLLCQAILCFGFVLICN